MREEMDGRVYQYLPLGKYVVSTPRVCRGHVTFKSTRIDVAGILDRLAAGESIDELVRLESGGFILVQPRNTILQL